MTVSADVDTTIAALRDEVCGLHAELEVVVGHTAGFDDPKAATGHPGRHVAGRPDDQLVPGR